MGGKPRSQPARCRLPQTGVPQVLLSRPGRAQPPPLKRPPDNKSNPPAQSPSRNFLPRICR
jgi:hypothetical protein